MTLMSPQELADHVGERIMCPHVATMERAAYFEARHLALAKEGEAFRGMMDDEFVRLMTAPKFSNVSPEIVLDAKCPQDPYVWHETSEFDR